MLVERLEVPCRAAYQACRRELLSPSPVFGAIAPPGTAIRERSGVIRDNSNMS